MSDSTVEKPVLNGVRITRIFDAPRAQIWKTWNDPEEIKKWWGPKDYTSPECKVDFRVGGKYLYCMKAKDGEEFWSTGTYKEITALEKIVCTDSFSDENGKIIHASQLGFPGNGWPMELHVTILFEDLEGKTKMTLIHLGFPSKRMEEMCAEGWNESFDKLEENLHQENLVSQIVGNNDQ